MTRALLGVMVFGMMSGCAAEKAHRPDPGAPGTSEARRRCGSALSGLDALAGARTIMLGEVHGLTAAPRFAGQLACLLATAGTPVMLGLEIPHQEQARIDRFLDSPAAAGDRATLLEGAFWHRPFQDGRSSQARVDLLAEVAALRQVGLPIRVVAFDDETTTGQAARELSMAQAITAARREGETAVVLVGNLHVRTRPGAPWDPSLAWMGVALSRAEATTVALGNRYASGEAWVCFGKTPDECGRHPVKGSGAPNAWGIERSPIPDDTGLHGWFDIGLAEPSPPAVATTPAAR